MLYLILELGGERYAIETGLIHQVLPYLRVRQLPGAPPAVAGLIDYHGEPVPVVDLDLLTRGTPTETKLSARIILAWCGSNNGKRCLLGILVPRASTVIRSDPKDFVDSGVSSLGASYLGSVLATDSGLVQKLITSQLLPDEIHTSLLLRSGAA